MAPVLDPALLPGLARLTLLARRRTDGAPGGSRVGRRRGLSLEFADHRRYVEGDDLRFLDWKVLARHDEPHLRRFHEEQALPVRLLLDRSASMGFGEPSKIALARTLAAGLAFVALANGAQLSLHTFAAAPDPPLGPLRGRRAFSLLSDRLSRLAAGGGSDLGAVARTVVGGRAGLTVIVSDFLGTVGFEDALRRLDHARHSLFLLRIVAPEESDPTLGGDVTLVDAETGAELSAALTPSLLAAYQRQHAELDLRIAAEARRREARAARISSAADPGHVFFAELAARGLVR